MSFANIYYKRTAATAKACFVCYKPTTTVLATTNTVDFLYTCPGHLTDPGFATEISNDNTTNAVKPTLTSEEIAKVKEEWEEKQRQKAERIKEKEREKEREKEKGKEAKDGDENKKSPSPDSKSLNGPPVHGSGSTTPAAPTHQKFILHRDFYAMRLAEHRKRRQMAQAKELAPRLPGAPQGSLQSSS
ncbi:VPS4-associated protein 1 [Infundibulicybe gibba]|nr:VPS4-associated protein 1 [Infundibulicybe gibba]